MASTAFPQSRTAKPPKEDVGFWSWFSTVDHKKLGILYIVFSMFFFIVAGMEALLIRLELAAPGRQLLSAQFYNQLFTMHGTSMIFLFVIPILTGFGNYFMPLQIGAADIAFPRVNALGLWVLVAGGIIMYASPILATFPDAGWRT
jgi:cytochrome c oxidase subunit I